MKILTLIVGLLAALPAFSEPRVYTNADLGRPLSPNRVTVTPEQLASLAAHQFVSPWVDRQWDPVVSSGSSPTSGPFGDYRQDIQPRRLDGSLWTDPPWQSLSYYPGYYPSYVPYAHAPYAGHSPARPPTANHRRSLSRPGRR
jgi:hypothetical protein